MVVILSKDIVITIETDMKDVVSSLLFKWMATTTTRGGLRCERNAGHRRGIKKDGGRATADRMRDDACRSPSMKHDRLLFICVIK
jgi:hypothetical protein